MKFYDRENELAELKRIQQLSFSDHSRMTVVTGRRRIGKTSLILKAVEASPIVYLFVARKNEAMLCADYIHTISQELEMYVPEGIANFRSLFQYLLEVAKSRTFNVVIDEFQEFFHVNESVYSDMQNLWDRYRLETRMNLIISGSVYSLMNNIFQDAKEPLFGRADNILQLSPFSITTLKEILSDFYPTYSNDDLLAFYTFTGGVPKYVELLCDNAALCVEEMIRFMVRDNSPILNEGKNLLIEEFGRNYATYFSILSAISAGINTQSAIESAMKEKSIGGYLKRLVDDYNVISRRRPILSKVGTQTVRYEITDNFICFWFNYFDRYRSLVEIKNYVALQNIVLSDYPTYSGRILERYFRQQLAETNHYSHIGSWWEAKSKQNEIDIVALNIDGRRALVAEVKRQRKNFKPEAFTEKTEHIKAKILSKYIIEGRCLSLDDM